MTESLDSERMACWRAYIEASQRLFTQLEDDLRADGELSFADYHVLVLLSEAPGQRLRMGELAGRLVFSPSRLTYQISTMQRRGLVAQAVLPRGPAGQRGGAHRRRAADPARGRAGAPRLGPRGT